jgi:2'-5' RNA ligase
MLNFMEKIRTFVAISLTSVLIDRLEKLITEMRPLAEGVKWVKPQSIHLTLKFLGNLTPVELERVFTGMEFARNEFPEPFVIQASGTGCFPAVRRPRVLWVGLTGESMATLQAMQNRIELQLKEQGFPLENRSFKPHLTVARIRDHRRVGGLLEKYINHEFPVTDLPVTEVKVMRSDLRPQGAVYTVQKTYNLGEVS